MTKFRLAPPLEHAGALRRRIIEAPPREWRLLAEESSLPILELVASDLLADASHAVFRAAYVQARAGGKSHDRALTVANRRLTQARRLLGYSYPAAAQLTF